MKLIKKLIIMFRFARREAAAESEQFQTSDLEDFQTSDLEDFFVKTPN